MDGLRRLAGGATTAALVAVIAGAVVLIGAHLGGYGLHLVRSGSMGDAVPVGSLAVTEPVAPERVVVGDVVVVDPPGRAEPRMHRVIDRGDDEGAVVVRTKGDANRTADAGASRLTADVPVPVAVVPLIGYPLLVLRSPAGIMAVVAVVVLVVGGSLLRRLWRAPSGAEPEPEPEPERERGTEPLTQPG